MSEPPVDPPQRRWCEECDTFAAECMCQFYWEDLYADSKYEQDRLGE